MNTSATAIPRCVAFVAVLVAAAAPFDARADVTRAVAAPVENVGHSLVVVADSSAAAAEAAPARAPYDATRTYARAGCDPRKIYWRRGGGAPPDCTSTQWVDAAATSDADGLRCDAARTALAARGWYAAGRIAQWSGAARQWTSLESGTRGAVECEDDRGRHGTVDGAWYAADGGASPWEPDPRAEIAWHAVGRADTLYAANYVAWWHGAPPAAAGSWRDAQRAALVASAPHVSGTLTVFRHSWNAAGAADVAAEGGMVLFGPSLRPDRAARLDALWSATPLGGGLPLAETLDEVARYLGARALRYGTDSRAAPALPSPSTAESQQAPGVYRTPLATACSRAAVVAMSASEPSQDVGALRANVLGLGAAACDPRIPGACAAVFARGIRSPQPGSALGAMTGRIDVAWFAARGLDSTLPGLLPRVAAPDELGALLLAEARTHLQGPGVATVTGTGAVVATITAGAGAAWAGWFVPSRADRWLGGLRRVRTSDGGATALEARPAAPSTRLLLTDLAGNELAAPANAVTIANARLAPADLGLDPTDTAARERVIRWVRGHDVDDTDADGNRDEARDDMGAVLGAPAIVRYAGGLTLAFAGSSDGFLHAFDGAIERWAYVPAPFLGRLASLHDSGSSGSRLAGIDGDLRVVLVDANGDRVVDAAAGDRAMLVFGMRRGGRAYVAVDVTSPEAPRRLWHVGPRELPGLAETWAAPVPVRLAIGGSAQSSGRQVVLLAGGHDPTQDRRAPRTHDRIGASVYLVDAWTGALLWHAAPRAIAGRVPDLIVPDLEYGIAATPRALDLDGDGDLDRAYLADTGGQVFRIDFARGARRDALAHAVRIAALGGVGAADRRFYAEPDVSVVRRGPGAPYVAIVLGSGFAPDPRDTGVADRLYSLRDVLPDPIRATRTPPDVRDADLPDATDTAATAPDRGWKRRLVDPGERVVVPARTADHRVLVPTWRAPAYVPTPDCTLTPGANRLLSVDVRDGRSLAFRVIESNERRSTAELPGAGIAPAAAFVSTPAPAGCRRCGPRISALLGASEIDLDWPGTLVHSGWVEREGE